MRSMSRSWPRRARIQRSSVMPTTPGVSTGTTITRARAVSTASTCAYATWISGRSRAPIVTVVASADHEVDQPARHHDDLRDGRAVEQRRDRGIRPRRLFDRDVVGVGADDHLAAHLAVDLDGDLHRVDHEP